MFTIYIQRSAALWVRCRVIIAGLLLVGVALQAILPGPVAQAATDSQVLIAVDATSPSCAYLISPGNHTSSGDDTPPEAASTTRIPCPPGTVIVTAAIPLSQAKVDHEAYVLPLSPQASSSQHTQWENQVHQLMQAKRRSLQANRAASPLTNCGLTVYLYSGYNVIFNDYIQGRVTYYVSQNCSNVFLDTIYVDAGYVPYNNPVYWVQFAYSYYRDTCHHAFDLLYPNTTYSYNPNIWEPSGLDAIYTYQSGGAGCFVNGGGPIQDVDIGTLN